MKSLSELIWNPETKKLNITNGSNIDKKPMREICMVAFCGTSGGGTDTAGSFYGCYQDRPMRTVACI